LFWDSSAIVPTLVPAAESSPLHAILQADPERTLWWGTPVECQSALFRRERDRHLTASLVQQGLQRLVALIQDVDFVGPTTRLRDRACRLVATHPLRAGDALQLAAALMWCGEAPDAGAPFVSLDARLRDAARREGFAILPD